MCRIVALVGSILSGLILAGCLPVTSTVPLGSTVPATADPQLTGMWKGNVGTAAAFMAFYPAGEGVWRIVVLATPAAKDEGGWMVFEARAARLGDNTYLDAREIEDSGKAPDAKLSHMPVLYSLGADGSLALSLIDEAAARTAIRKGAIAGTVEPGEFGDVAITADAAKLDAFFASDGGRALFVKPLATLKRAD